MLGGAGGLVSVMPGTALTARSTRCRRRRRRPGLNANLALVHRVYPRRQRDDAADRSDPGRANLFDRLLSDISDDEPSSSFS